MAGTVHIVGAGIAGLAAAVELAGAGHFVVMHEGAGHAGGRCRSFHDDALGCLVDNGNHLLLSGNRAAVAYLDRIGARGTLHEADAVFPFLDLRTGARWDIRPSAGPFPWWVLSPATRAPGTGAMDYLRGLGLFFAGRNFTVAEALGLPKGGSGREMFWDPLTIAVLNAEADEVAAPLLWAVLRETVGRGARACRPLIARLGLGPSLIEPALAYLARRGAVLRFNARLRAIEFEGGVARTIRFADGEVALGEGDRVIVALPQGLIGEFLPGIPTPEGTRAIVNAHFRIPSHPGEPRLLGLVGGTAQWVFVRESLASVTVSAADKLADEEAETIAERVWADVRRALDLGPGPLPPHRIVKEKRATFAQTPANLARRAKTRTPWRNLFLAGDWTDTGLPATLEGAIRSGISAAKAALEPRAP
ncbi:MAG: FAD-dependent oxidoreductase [Rhodospirillales bacterium]|nr:FAD-dependent oxidoreductase [Rhodospirillales bacterium]